MVCGCQSPEHRFSRRRFLFNAAASSAFLGLARRGDADVTATGARMRNTARACIFVHLVGAPSQLDTFDPKDGPWNPADAGLQQYPGGLVLSQTMFPNLSKISRDLCVLRSVRSWEAVHERGQFYSQTTHPANPAFLAEVPNIGSVVAMEKGNTGRVPPFLALNSGGTVLQGAKFLGGRVEPFTAPSNAGGLTTLQHSGFSAQASQQRFNQRFNLLQDLDANLRSAPFDPEMGSHAAFYTAAQQLMYDASIAAVFQFTSDEDSRYGSTAFGRSCLVARNAIQAKNGTVFINLFTTGWDTHQSMYDRRYTPNMYQLNGDLDRGLGNLVADLKSSGDFDRTLIVVMGEFGRSAGELNPRGGRDHHRDCQSVLLMGGGVRGGKAIGATDAIGDQIADPGWSQNRVIVMEDIAATIYSALGIDWTKSIADTPSGRKFEYVPFATVGTYVPVEEVFE
ncbi:MAG: hypothetical protein C5B51_11705 [Terriglobia bacterium]|nr:MAG: hypothetical protein C5B51_11705 [Terriglobia bacterium]